MKRGIFLVVVAIFALFSLFVFYLDSTKDCGSLVCVSKFISSGETETTNYELSDSLFSKIILPFVNPSGEDILLQPAGTCFSVTQYDITWTFSTDVTCGQFANGDWYVVAPVTIISKTPSPTSSPFRHGDRINTNFMDPLGQPFDDRLGPIIIPPNPLIPFAGPTFNQFLRPTYPISFDENTYPNGASLISTISQPETTNCGSGESAGFTTFSDVPGTYETHCNPGPIKDLAILTIVTTEPPTGSFRPSTEEGVNKNIQFNVNQINYGALGTVQATPSLLSYSLSDVHRHIQRPKPEMSYWDQAGLTAGRNAHGYGQFDANDLGLASLLVNVGDYTNLEKEPLVISLIQRGIDTYGVYENGDYTDWMSVNYGHAAWPAEGGHGLGRFFPIVFAGTLLGDATMSQIGTTMNYDFFFTEQGSTFLVADQPAQPSGFTLTKDMLIHSIYCATGGINCGHGGYVSTDLFMPEYGFAHYNSPNSDLKSWDPVLDAYKFCCTANTWNSYLLASYMMGIEDLWNAPEFLAYTDRYMEATDSSSAFFANPNIADWHRSWYPAFEDMWDLHRSDYTVEWTEGNICEIEGQSYSCPLQLGVCGDHPTVICTMRNLACDYEAANPAYEEVETISNDGLDNDCDGLIDETSLPIAPSSLVVTQVDSSSLQINWVDNSNDELGFRLQYKLSTDSVWTDVPGASNLLIDTENFLHSGLSPYTSYDYRVFAYNSNGESMSNVNFAYTLPVAPVINSINPNIDYNDASELITFTGSGFVSQFTIVARLLSNPLVESLICSTALGLPGCTFVDSNTVTANFDLGSFPPDVYEVAYVNMQPFITGTGPLVPSNYDVTLTVEDFPNSPVISNLNPLTIQHNTAKTIQFTVADSTPAYVISTRVDGGTTAVPYCSHLDTGICNLVGNTLSVTFPAGYTPGNYEVEFIALHPRAVILESNFLDFTVEATTCLDGFNTQSCGNQLGVCAGSLAACVNGEFEVCDSTNYLANNANYQSTENSCFDGLDNDCNGFGDTTGTPGNTHGDIQCPAEVTAIISPSSTFTNTNFEVQCTSTVPNINSIVGSLDGGLCSFVDWNGNNARFNCISSSLPGTQVAECDVDPTKSFQAGTAIQTNVQILASTCSGYASSGLCEADSSCDWLTACSITNPQQSSGGMDRCVATGTGSFQCIQNQCGAVWDETSGGCSSSQEGNPITCGCIEQNPFIIDSLPASFPWGSDTTVTIIGNYFSIVPKAQVFVDGQEIDSSRLTVTSNNIVFDYVAEEFGVGAHQVRVRNSVSGLESNIDTFVLTSNPSISSIVPNVVTNDILQVVNINGIDFDPLAKVMLFDVIDLTSLTTYVNSGLIQLSILSGFPGSDLSITVLSGDNLVSSNPQNIRVNYPFYYDLFLDPPNAVIVSGTSLDVDVNLVSNPYMTHEEVVLSLTSSPELTVSFVGSDRCTPSGIGTTADYTCQVTINVLASGIITDSNYFVTVSGTSGLTNFQQEVDLNLDGEIGVIADCTNLGLDGHETDVDCGGPICRIGPYLCAEGQGCILDSDCFANGICSQNICRADSDGDGVFDGDDVCPGTLPLATVNALGCPLPIYDEFSPSITTPFVSVIDLTQVQDMSLGIDGVGRIQFLGQQLSVLRLVSGFYQALNLNDAVEITNNLISIDVINNPELDQSATVTIDGLIYTEAPTPTIQTLTGFAVCPSTQCASVSYDSQTGRFVMTVAGFDNAYSTQAATINDGVCTLSETCSSAPLDCGACPSGTSGGSSGGGGGGGGGGSGGARPIAVVTQCNDKIDNDNDGLIDYPQDTGCTNAQDNIEREVVSLIDDGQEEPNNIFTPIEKVFEIRIVFWFVLIALIGGIVVVSTIIIKHFLGQGKFNSLTKVNSYSSQASTGI